MFFDNKARRPSYDGGYAKYVGRCATTSKDKVLDKSSFVKVINAYCKMLAERLESEGTIDLPSNMGSIVAVSIRRKPTYDKRAGKWRLRHGVDWESYRKDGEVKYKDDRYTFGFIYSPRREKGYENLRCYGIRLNSRLYARMRKQYDAGELPFHLSDIENFV